ncbi:TetR family transcriptional regulator [Streptomyces sp. PG2]
MREIARQAGVGIATAFRHFPTREASSRPSTGTRSSG